LLSFFFGSDEGPVIVVGRKGEPIRLTYADARNYRPANEKDMIREAGSPKAVLIDGKPATAEKLMEQFVTEVTKKAKP
jgi:hypothetical protein